MKNPACHITWRTKALLVVLVLLSVSWGVFHARIQHTVARYLILISAAPNPDSFSESARTAEDPVEFLERSWATGKVAQRQLVASFLKENAATPLPWMDRAQPLLRACTIDADASVRELGLAALEQLHSPLLFQAAAVQLNDLDPLVRRLGLEYLRKSDPKFAVPLLVKALDDPDLRNVTTAEIVLARFSGEDFGVRASEAIRVTTDDKGTNSVKLEAIHRGVEKRKEWWRQHQGDYAPNFSDSDFTKNLRPTDAVGPSAPDFSLRNLEGKRVKLSDFRGKAVLVNFWATWCTACLKEIPDLVTVQEKLGNKVAILGISMDGVPDEDGDTPGKGNQVQKQAEQPRSIRALVERAVKLRHINYPVLLDPKGIVGGQYNGGELPTTVIFDVEGRVRRRFIGERSVAVFESMLSEASNPPRSIAAPTVLK
jgi:cytochrome c biogenesis protein CcmG, thiol:disulfide interchange protein DsbE